MENKQNLYLVVVIGNREGRTLVFPSNCDVVLISVSCCLVGLLVPASDSSGNDRDCIFILYKGRAVPVEL